MNRRTILKSIFVAPIAALLGTKLVATKTTECRRCGSRFPSTPEEHYLCEGCVEHIRFLMEGSQRKTAAQKGWRKS